MRPVDESLQPQGRTEGSQEPQRLDSRAGSCNEALLSKSPIRKVSHPNKSRPSLQKSEDNRGNRTDSSHSDGTVNQASKERNVSQGPRSSPSSPPPSVFPKSPKSVVSQGTKYSLKEDTHHSRTNSLDNELSTALPSVAKMVSMIERKGGPPPVPTSARPKLTVALASNQSTMAAVVEKKQYPAITGNCASAKPVPLASLDPSSSKPSTSEGLGKQEASKDGSKSAKSSTKQRRIAPQRMESVILLSSHSRSQNLWNARLQNSNSVRLLSGPHFTFNVT